MHIFVLYFKLNKMTCGKLTIIRLGRNGINPPTIKKKDREYSAASVLIFLIRDLTHTATLTGDSDPTRTAVKNAQ